MGILIPGQDLGEKLLRDGLTLQGVDKIKAEWFERKQYSPEQVFGEPFPKEAWRLVVDVLMRQRKKMAQRADQREDCDIAIVTAKLVDPGTTPWDALVLQADCCIEKFGKTRGIAQMFLREACYKVLNEEFVGRKVG